MAGELSVDLTEAVDLLLPQYDAAVNLRTLIAGITATLQTEAMDVLCVVDRGFNPDESAGFVLDMLGCRIGLTRPFVRTEDATYYGFEGTMAAGGRPFGQAPFFTLRASIEQVVPYGDIGYRQMIKGRARRLRGGANRETIEAVANLIFGADTSYLDESGADLEVVVDTEDQGLFNIVNSAAYRPLLIPRPAGCTMTMRRI